MAQIIWIRQKSCDICMSSYKHIEWFGMYIYWNNWRYFFLVKFDQNHMGNIPIKLLTIWRKKLINKEYTTLDKSLKNKILLLFLLSSAKESENFRNVGAWFHFPMEFDFVEFIRFLCHFFALKCLWCNTTR